MASIMGCGLLSVSLFMLGVEMESTSGSVVKVLIDEGRM